MVVSLFLIIIGLSGGLVVGSGLIAFITVLDIVPRLAQLTRTQNKIIFYEWALILGSVFWTVTDLFDLPFSFPWSNVFVFIIGSFTGLFVGLLAAALTEVINVLPILAKRIGMTDRILFLLMAMVFGKVFGSLFHWLIFLEP